VTDELPPPPPLPGNSAVSVIERDHPPRVGELSSLWRTVTAVTWIGVILAFSAIWNTSAQLGLSTWWLGARSDPQPLFVRLLPFVAPVLMVLGTINRVRWLCWYGLGASAVLVAIGVGDVGRVTRIGALEIAVGVGAAAVSLASLSGTYRPVD
jgi:hypothetical protein